MKTDRIRVRESRRERSTISVFLFFSGIVDGVPLLTGLERVIQTH